MARLWRSAVVIGLFTSCLTSAQSATSSETINYTYDARGRLVTVGRSGTINNGVNANYSYDRADNRSNVTVSGPGFAVNDPSATEGSALVFTVTRTTTGSTMSVVYSTSDGTATAGNDYGSASGTLNFGIGEASKQVSIITMDDTAVEPAETVILTLSNPVGGAIIDGTGIGTINDNDVLPPCQGVSFTVSSNGAVTEGGSSGFTVSKSGSASGSCSVNFSTSDGSAAAGSDYNAASGTLTFASWETAKGVNVATIDDGTVESAETFTLSLSSPTGGAALGSPGSASATINDNDVLPPAVFNIADASAPEGDVLVFTVTRSVTVGTAVSVNYATANNTALAGYDFGAVSGTLNFAANETSKTISVPAYDDLQVEGTETFTVNLSSPSGATISDGQAIGSIINTTEAPCYDESGRRIPCD